MHVNGEEKENNMKSIEFVELPIYTYHPDRGWWGESSLINMNKVVKIEPDKNYTKILYTNGKSDVISLDYDKVFEIINH